MFNLLIALCADAFHFQLVLAYLQFLCVNKYSIYDLQVVVIPVPVCTKNPKRLVVLDHCKLNSIDAICVVFYSLFFTFRD